jgi:hypothetical protein
MARCLNGDDLRREPLYVRKATLRSLLVKTGPGLRWNEHIEGDGETIFRHACKLGLEGIVGGEKGCCDRGLSGSLQTLAMRGHHPAMRYRGDRGQSTRAYSVGGRTGHERLRYFQERMPHGLFVPDEAISALPWPFRR